MSRLWSTCPLDCPAIPVGAFFGWMALTVWADAGPGTEAGVDTEAAGFGVGEADLLGPPDGDGEALEDGEGAGTAACETDGLGEGPGEDCWERGAAVQATIQTSRTAGRRATRWRASGGRI